MPWLLSQHVGVWGFTVHLKIKECLLLSFFFTCLIKLKILTLRPRGNSKGKYWELTMHTRVMWKSFLYECFHCFNRIRIQASSELNPVARKHFSTYSGNFTFISDSNSGEKSVSTESLETKLETKTAPMILLLSLLLMAFHWDYIWLCQYNDIKILTTGHWRQTLYYQMPPAWCHLGCH